MGKDTGFLEYTRKNNIDVPPKDRIENFEEFHKTFEENEKEQAIMSAMKIFIEENKESKKYISEIKSALQQAGHQVFLNSDFADAKEGLQSCHVRMDLRAAGMSNDQESIDRPFVRTESIACSFLRNAREQAKERVVPF